jgi:hypothetical protein
MNFLIQFLSKEFIVGRIRYKNKTASLTMGTFGMSFFHNVITVQCSNAEQPNAKRQNSVAFITFGIVSFGIQLFGIPSFGIPS